MAAHSLTRQQMEQVINEGGSVLIHPADGGLGTPITSHAALPSEAELAGNDAAKRARVRSALLEQQRHLQAQLALVAGPEETPPAKDRAEKDETPARAPKKGD